MSPSAAGGRNVTLQSPRSTGKLRSPMEEAAIQVGDRVVNLQVPGVFLVVARRGVLLDLESDIGVRMTLHESGVRRLDPAPRDG